MKNGRRGFVRSRPGVITEGQIFEGEFASDYDERSLDAHPALVHLAGLIARQVEGYAFVEPLIEQADDVAFDADAVGDP